MPRAELHHIPEGDDDSTLTMVCHVVDDRIVTGDVDHSPVTTIALRGESGYECLEFTVDGDRDDEIRTCDEIGVSLTFCQLRQLRDFIDEAYALASALAAMPVDSPTVDEPTAK